MPTASGQMTLNDFDQLLVKRGFDAIDQIERFQFINFGYRRIAAKFPWEWQKTRASVTKNPGDYQITRTDLPTLRSIDYIYIDTPNHLRRLHPANEQRFYESWMAMDLTLASNRGDTSEYFWEDRAIYLLPPPNVQLIFDIHYYQYLPDLSLTLPGTSDVPMTPQYADQAILIAAESEAHKRTYEIQLAAQKEADLGDWFDTLRLQDETEDENLQQRVEPDDTWL